MVKLSQTGITLPYYSTVEEIVDINKKRYRETPKCPQKSDSPPKHQPLRVASVPTMSYMMQDENKRVPLKKRMKRSESSIFSLQEPTKECIAPRPMVNGHLKPEEYLKSIVEEFGASIESINVDLDSFLSIEKQQDSCYPHAAIAARTEDLPLLRKLHLEGRNLQCANKFGESIIHIICRRRRDDILNFLVAEVGVSLRLRDDLGRTPFHDAAWTDQPNFKVVTQLLEQEPDLIFVRDNRGNSPLSYIPRQNWGEWNQFLDKNRNLFLPGGNDVLRIVG